MLQVRSHLDQCEECRREYEALLQIKRLLGSLPEAAPRRPFDPAVLDLPPRPLWRTWMNRLSGQIGALTAYAGLHRRSLNHSLLTFPGVPGKLALSGALAIVFASAALLHAPQHADAVSAHVPAQVTANEVDPVLLPLDAVVAAPVLDPLPEELRALQAAQVPGAENPIRPVAHTAVLLEGPAPFGTYPPHGHAYYPRAFSGAMPVVHVSIGDGYR